MVAADDRCHHFFYRCHYKTLRLQIHLTTNDIVMNFSKRSSWLILVSCFLLSTRVNAQSNPAGKFEFVNQFYEVKQEVLFWYSSDNRNAKMRADFRSMLDSASCLGLDRNDYHYDELFGNLSQTDVLDQTARERLFTESVFMFYRDVYAGRDADNMFSYNAFSYKYSGVADSLLLSAIAAIKHPGDFASLLKQLEPATLSYTSLKSELRKQLEEGDLPKIGQLKSAMNIQRWISHLKLEQYIVVNIASATLKYYERGIPVLEMKTVMGKPVTKTPRFAAYCNQVIFYPYWHVPHSIAVNEMLPLCKKNPAILDALNIQVVNSSGSIIDPESINWKGLSKSNFPYQLRQSTGCDNALGVIKFNLISPYSVYLHDTNYKDAFQSDRRYYSHGCIRIEKPIELANYLLPDKVDVSFLKACSRNQKPIVYDLLKQVPVFVIYATADVSDSNVIKYHTDVYHLND